MTYSWACRRAREPRRDGGGDWWLHGGRRLQGVGLHRHHQRHYQSVPVSRRPDRFGHRQLPGHRFAIEQRRRIVGDRPGCLPAQHLYAFRDKRIVQHCQWRRCPGHLLPMHGDSGRCLRARREGLHRHGYLAVPDRFAGHVWYFGLRREPPNSHLHLYFHALRLWRENLQLYLALGRLERHRVW